MDHEDVYGGDDDNHGYGYDENGEPVNPFAWNASEHPGRKKAVRKDPVPTPPNEDRRYVCMRCKTDLLLSVVKRIERIEPVNYALGKTTVRVVHDCPCANFVRAAVYPWDDQALARLFGSPRFSLPWPTTQGDERGEVAVGSPAPAPKPTWLDRREAVLDRWAWDLDGVTTAQDFLSQCRGPRSRDSEIVAEFKTREAVRRRQGRS